MKLHCQITQEDIDHGERGHCVQCPAARAVNRAIAAGYVAGPLLTAKVGSYVIDLEDDDNEAVLRSDTPLDVRMFIANFDGRGDAHPMEFDLEFKKIEDFYKPVVGGEPFAPAQ